MRKKSKKIEKKAVRRVCTGWVGGLAVAAGEVRRGNPSGTGRLEATIQNHASTPLGYGEFTTLRETAAPATEGQGNKGETQTVEQQLIRNWAKLGTELEQKQKGTNDQSNA